jgi:hypothetical protein
MQQGRGGMRSQHGVSGHALQSPRLRLMKKLDAVGGAQCTPLDRRRHRPSPSLRGRSSCMIRMTSKAPGSSASTSILSFWRRRQFGCSSVGCSRRYRLQEWQQVCALPGGQARLAPLHSSVAVSQSLYHPSSAHRYPQFTGLTGDLVVRFPAEQLTRQRDHKSSQGRRRQLNRVLDPRKQLRERDGLSAGGRWIRTISPPSIKPRSGAPCGFRVRVHQLGEPPIPGGTGSSNPSPSRGESTNHRFRRRFHGLEITKEKHRKP